MFKEWTKTSPKPNLVSPTTGVKLWMLPWVYQKYNISLSADPWKMGYWYQNEALIAIYTSWSVYLPQVSESAWRTSVGHSLIGNIVRYHMISCTSQLSAKHIWTLQGYVDLMRGMPINAHSIPISGSADRLYAHQRRFFVLQYTFYVYKSNLSSIFKLQL